MIKKIAQNIAQDLFSEADIKINGTRPWDIHVHDERFYKRALIDGSLGLGESYMEGWWSVKKLDEFLARLLSSNLDKRYTTLRTSMIQAKSIVLNAQTLSGSKKVAQLHYDLGNEFYSDMLDKRMQYTCAYWKDAKTLEKAQENKLELICKKLELKPGEKVLELGSGWGGFAKYASENYGVHVTSYNISHEQVEFAKTITSKKHVKVVEDDYRNAKGLFDKVVSIGMCEHVGYKNYRTFMEVADKSLKDGGLFLIHTIGRNTSTTHTDPFIEKYIFPNSMIPSAKQLTEAFEGVFVLEDWHNFGPDYDKTCMAWHDNFKKNWNKHKDKYGEEFFRMFEFYLLGSAASFRVRNNNLWQIVLSKGRKEGTYNSIR